MAQESRVKKTLLNARVNLIFYFLSLVLSFFSRKIFLDCLGASFVGLTGTLQNLLGFLNLAELGVGTAIGYLLYKPLFDNDHIKINEIISVMGYLYRWIGLIILGAGVILSCFLPLIFPYKDTGFHYALIYFAYYSFLASSLIGYFINYRQNLLAADQRNYVVTAYFQTGNIIKILIQLTLAYYTHNLYYWVAIEFIFGIIYSFILNWKINKTYPWLKSDVKAGRLLFKKYPEVMTKTKQLFVHRISAFAQFQTSPFLIYAFVSLDVVAYYGNYTIIVEKISQFLRNLFGSVSAGVGNLIAEGNKNKIIEVYWQLFSIQFFVIGIMCFGILAFANTFITLWLGSRYLLSNIVLILIVINFFFGLSRSVNDPFIFGSGMFHDTWAPITESIIYLIVAIVGGYYWGLCGVLMGSVVSTFLIIGLWKPYFLFVKGFKTSYLDYWIGWFKHMVPLLILVIAGIYILNKYFLTMAMTWLDFILVTLSALFIFVFVLFVTYYILYSSFREGIKRFIKR